MKNLTGTSHTPIPRIQLRCGCAVGHVKCDVARGMWEDYQQALSLARPQVYPGTILSLYRDHMAMGWASR